MLTVRIPDDLRAGLDELRGDVPRERLVRGILQHWVNEERRAVESALAGSGAPAEVAPVSARPPSAAPTRSSGHPQRCPDCGGLHKGDCPAHPRAGR